VAAANVCSSVTCTGGAFFSKNRNMLDKFTNVVHNDVMVALEKSGNV
jgi:hypothetical protein